GPLGPRFIACGEFQVGGFSTEMAYWDGAAWQRIGQFSRRVTSAAIFDADDEGPVTPDIVAGAESGLDRWNGSRWRTFGGPNSQVTCMIRFDLDGPGPDPERTIIG